MSRFPARCQKREGKRQQEEQVQNDVEWRAGDHRPAAVHHIPPDDPGKDDFPPDLRIVDINLRGDQPQHDAEADGETACNRCHEDQTTDWAIEAVEKWYGDRMNRPTRDRARWIAVGRPVCGDWCVDDV